MFERFAGVMREIEEVLQKIEVFKPDRFNYWQMGNNLHHLHFHGIPRYKTARFFAGYKWVDKSWGTIPIWSRKDVKEKLVIKIRDKIKEVLDKV